MKYSALGEIVKANREKLGWDQSTLAKAMQVKQQSVSRWETGLSRPERDAISSLAEILQTDHDMMLSASGYEVPKPIRPLLPILPLNNLTAENFELLCRAFVAALSGDAEVARYGGPGHRQEGIDIISGSGQRVNVYQCKRHLQFGPKNIDEAVAATKFAADNYYLLLSRKATPGARDAILKYENWTLWDIEDISSKIQMEIPKDEAIRIVDTFFPGFRMDFLGEPNPSPWLSAVEFFRPLANRVRLFNHAWSFVGRQSEINYLQAFIKSESDQVLILAGRGGIGKTRLLRAFSERVPPSAKVQFVSPMADIKPRDFELLPLNGILVIDDAHEHSDLAQLLASIALMRPKFKVLLSTRPFGVPQIQHELTRAGFDFKADSNVVLNDLSINEAKSLAREVLENCAGDIVHAKKIAEVTRDCPLATVIGSRLVATGAIEPDLLNNSEEFRRHILMTFRNIITGEIGGPQDALYYQELLDFVATIQPIDPTDPAFELAAKELLDKRYDKVLRALRDLEEAGVLLRRRHRLRIAPDLLADYIRAEAAYDVKNSRPTGFVDEVFKIIQPAHVINLLVNLSQLDWRISATGVQSALLKNVWTELEVQFARSDNRTRQTLLGALERVAYYQPAHALSFAELAVAQSATAGEHAHDILSRLPLLLKNVAYNSEYLTKTLDLLRDLASQDHRDPNRHPEHAMRALCELACLEPGKPLEFNEMVVNHVLGWLAGENARNFSPFDVLDSMLATEGHQPELEGNTVVMSPFRVVAAAVSNIRTKIIDAAFDAVSTKPLPEASRALKTIGESLVNRVLPNDSEHDRAQWLPGQLAVLDRLKGLASDKTLDPYLTVEIRRAISWQTNFSNGPMRVAADEVLAAIPTDTEYEVSLAIADGWGRTFERSDNHLGSAQSFITWRRQLASRLIQNNKDNFEALICQLEDRLTKLGQIQDSRQTDPTQFIAALSVASPAFGKLLATHIVNNSHTSLAVCFGVILVALAETELDTALEYAETALQAANPDLVNQVSWFMGWGLRGRTATDREIALIKTLMRSDDSRVRQNAASSVDRIGALQKSAAIDMLLSIQLSDNMDVAEQVFSQFGSHGSISVNELSAEQIKLILSKLVPIRSIDDYHVLAFLSQLLALEPELTLKLFMDRVEYKEAHRDRSDYWPIPLSFSHHKPLHFYRASSYYTLLRTVRDWYFVETGDWIRKHFGKFLFDAVSADFDDVTLSILNEWVTSPDSKRLEAAASLLSQINRSFLWSRSDYVISLLNRAEKHGEACLNRVASNLQVIAYQGSRIGTPGQPYPEDIEQRDNSKELMMIHPIGSPAYRFYKSLYDMAVSNIRRDLEDDQDLFEG